jgi:hypothetical protein
MSCTEHIFSLLGETGKFVLLLSISAFGLLVLGPINEQWKKTYRQEAK